jgi:type IV pilus assembly protein PilM
VRDNHAEKIKLALVFIKEFITEYRIKNIEGRISIYGKGVFIFSLAVPNLTRKDLRGAVGIELKKRLPFQLDINNVAFDFFITGQVREEKGTLLQVTCIAADRIAIEEQARMLKDLNIRPIGIYAIPDALGNLIPYCFSAFSQKTVCLLDIGANTSLLNFYKGSDLVFFREIPVGGEHLSHALAKTMTIGDTDITISIDEAEKLKRNCGIPLDDEAKTEFMTDFGALRGEQISAMLRPTLEKLVMEISRTFSYYSKTFKTDNISELFLTGGSSRLRNIDKFLLFNLEMLKRVEPLNILKGLSGWADKSLLKHELVMEQAAPHLAVALGLCLERGGRINLLPARERLEHKTAILSNVLRITFPFILGLSLLFYAFSYLNARKYKAFTAQLDAQISRLEDTAGQVKQYRQMKARFEQRQDALAQAKGKQPYWWGVLKELGNITPKEAVLTRISSDPEKEPKEIHLFGKIYAKYTIVDIALSQYIMALEESPYFSRVEMVSSKNDMYSPMPAADFEIVCQLKY